MEPALVTEKFFVQVIKRVHCVVMNWQPFEYHAFGHSSLCNAVRDAVMSHVQEFCSKCKRYTVSTVGFVFLADEANQKSLRKLAEVEILGACFF